MYEMKISIPARLKNVAKNGHVAGTEDIYDDELQKTQKEINAEQEGSIADLDGKITAETERAEEYEQHLRVDVDDNAEDIESLRVEVQSEQMVIGATVFDPWPVQNSNHPVTSHGIYTKNIQAEIVVGDPTGDWDPTTAEAAYENIQAQVNLLNAEINAAQLEIGAVQTDLVPTEDSPNMLPSGAIYNLLQTLAVAGNVVETI